MSNLLDRSSLVLTPTAYNNGEALCIKPDDASGDFQFSRNSAATRVNAQGLVENVQILSSNLVQNGDFSEEGVQEVSNGSFSQEGVQQIVNGSFDTDTNWNKASGVTISDGKANAAFGSSGNILRQSLVTFDANKTYKYEFTISNYVSGNLKFASFIGAVNESGNGTYVGYGKPNGTGVNNMILFGSFEGSIDNVSVREVGQDWTLGTGWSIGTDKAIFDGAGFSPARTNAGLITGKTYKVTFDLDITSGNVVVQLGGATNTFNTSTTHTFYDTATANGSYSSFVSLYSSLTSNFSITNISVKEVGQNWTLQPKWSIGNGFAQLISNDSTGSSLIPNTSIINGNKYNCSFDAVVNSGSCKLQGSSGTTYQIIDETKTYSFNFISDSGDIYFNRLSAISNITITNVNIVEITTDTSLPRINYEGFSYQDALGSEEIVNGSFDDGITGWSTSGSTPATVLNGIATIPNTSYIFQNALADGKQGKIVVSGNGSVRYRLGTNLFYSGQTAMPFTVYGTFGQNARIQIQNSSGTDITIDNVSVKEYLGQEVVPDSGCGSWLWEPQSTNLITQSELLNLSLSQKVDTTITDNFGVSPSGQLNSSRIQFADATSFCYGVISISTTHTASVYVKGTSGETIRFGIGGNVTTGDLFTFNGLWQRIEYTTASATQIFFSSYGGATATDFEAFGLQLEALSYATSYIPTNGEANGVTRNQDVCTNGGSLATINSTEGVLYAEIAALGLGASASLGLNDGSGANRVLILLQSNGDIRGFVASNNTIVFDEIYSGISTLNNNKIAVSYKLNQFSLWINGIKRFTDTIGNTPIGLNQLDFDNGSGASNFFGKTKAVAVFPYLSDSELQSLTTI